MGIMMRYHHIDSNGLGDGLELEVFFVHKEYGAGWSGLFRRFSTGVERTPLYEPRILTYAVCLTGRMSCSRIRYPARFRLSRATPRRANNSGGASGASMSALVR